MRHLFINIVPNFQYTLIYNLNKYFIFFAKNSLVLGRTCLFTRKRVKKSGKHNFALKMYLDAIKIIQSDEEIEFYNI